MARGVLGGVSFLGIHIIYIYILGVRDLGPSRRHSALSVYRCRGGGEGWMAEFGWGSEGIAELWWGFFREPWWEIGM